MGALLLPSERSTRFGNPAWPGGRAANFAVFGSWPGALPKNAESLRNSDAHKRIAVPQALCVLREHLRPRLKSGKVCRSDTRPGDVRECAARVEGNDSAPVRNAPCFAVCAVVCDPVGEGECVPAFTCENEREPFVRV